MLGSVWRGSLQGSAHADQAPENTNKDLSKFPRSSGAMADILTYLSDVDFVPPSLPPLNGHGKLIVLEGNEAVIKMTIKGRSTSVRHIQRTHRVNLDWLFERFLNDKGMRIRYLSTKFQIADMLTKFLSGSEAMRFLSNMGYVCRDGQHPLALKA